MSRDVLQKCIEEYFSKPNLLKLIELASIMRYPAAAQSWPGAVGHPYFFVPREVLKALRNFHHIEVDG